MNIDGKAELKRTYIWGTGKIAKYVYHFYYNELESYNIVGCIDNDKAKEGKTFEGTDIRIFRPDVLKCDQQSQVIILAAAYQEIEQQIINDYPWMCGRVQSPLLFTKQRLISRYKSTGNEEIKDILCYLKDHPLQVFNYEFTAKYNNRNYDIVYDEQAGLFYTMFENKRMYFARNLDSEEKVIDYYRQVRLEQDIESPHKYLHEDFQVDSNSVVIDAGVAEGNFALSVIDKVKKIYLFESDPDWIEALKYTFAPYSDKVILVNKYLSDYVDASTVSVDSLVEEEQIDFMKLDIEGEEYYALEGARNTISSSTRMKCVVCTYHKEFDYIALSQLLQGFGFDIETSKGYMWFPYDRNSIYDLPTLRRVLIRAKK